MDSTTSTSNLIPVSMDGRERPVSLSRTPSRPPSRAPWLRLAAAPAVLVTLLLTFSCCISLSSASSFYIDEQMMESIEPDDFVENLGPALASLAESGTILVDQRPPPDPKAWTLATENDDLERRGLESSSGGSPASSSSTVTVTTTSASAATSIAAATTAAAAPLPSPFDQGFSGNITQSCQTFMTTMLSNATFEACLPFSLLLQVPPPHPLLGWC
jgi:hypothetical protein